MKKFALYVLVAMVAATKVLAQESTDVYPANWWVHMKNPALQVMLHGKNIAAEKKTLKVSIHYPGVQLRGFTTVGNPNYLFIDLVISATAKPGTFTIAVSGHAPAAEKKITFELKPRRAGNGVAYAQGVTSADFIYFLMPDRFSNGDESNDHVPGMRDQSLNRDSIFLRHGGDMQGVLNHLDYLQSLGVTTLWMTPVLENDMPNRTEHGYAITNQYKVDPRLGGEQAYLKLGDELHRRGMKLIQDAVYNHIGYYNFLVQDAPDSTWLHQWPSLTFPNYKEQVFFDPHASAYDRKKMADGWFTGMMPDVNQSNPVVARFLIQHAIWCVETFGVDAWRIDTYKYVEPDFMNACNKALTDEYPHITMFGENWDEGVVNQAYFTKNIFNTPFKSNLTGSIDFEFLFRGIEPALTHAPYGVNQLYQTVSLDFLYAEPMNNVVFLDNHDMSRFLSQVNEDTARLKMGLCWLFTTRGIPQLYYGTEVLMKGISNPDGLVRLDFPGGWKGDRKNAFTGQGLTAGEQSIQAFTRRLGMFRKTASAITTGKMMQFVPENGVYVYFRYNPQQTIMCIMNTNTQPSTVPLARFAERLNNFTSGVDIPSGAHISLGKSLVVAGTTMLVLNLEK